MSKPIRRVGVIGAGVMGSGIAAHLANAGIEVVLLDIVPPNLTEAEKSNKKARDKFAATGIENALKIKPAAFMHKQNARLITIGNIDDDLGKTATCDLVIEAVLERLDVKQALFTKLEAIVPDHCIVASNTSGLRIHDMMQGRSDSFKKRFLVMHFFNPVRYMKLLELVAGPETDPNTVAHIQRFGEDQLGKGIVYGKDTPNFVGNRVGVHAMMTTIHLMLEDGLSPEDVDAISGSPMGHPRSASFGTADLVGLDTFVHVASNCHASLVDDEEREVFKVPAFIQAMTEKKLLGNKTKAGFYRRKRGADGKEATETFDPRTLEYRAKGGDESVIKACKAISKIEDTPGRIRALYEDKGKAGAFAWKVLSRSLSYSARRIGEIVDGSNGVVAIDDAMKWGYNWEVGPFETWDLLGVAAIYDRMIADGIKLPASLKKLRDSGKGFYDGDKVFDLVKGEHVARHVDPRTATFEILRKGQSPVLKNGGAEAWDLGQGVLGLTFKTKANSIDADVIQMLHDAVAEAEANFEGMVLSNTGDNFCVGANLFGVVAASMQGAWPELRVMVKSIQSACQRMKYSRVPVVVAPYGFTMGGGLELCLGAGAVQAFSETYCGLVEPAVGLIPGGGGTMNLLYRMLETQPEGAAVNVMELTMQAFKNIAMVRVATSAEEAKAFGYFRRTDGVSFDRARLLHEAKERAIGLAKAGWKPQQPRAFVLTGESGIATLSMAVDTMVAGGFATPHDAKIARKLAEVLCGGVGGASREVTEQDMLDLECEAFISLCGEPLSQARMQYMLMNNKPLRN
ncbi:MAG: 3-hydroxyacyl-CoA dehydrogenase/enoyl-CoA hydratase family protein [Polyangiales bacterium]